MSTGSSRYKIGGAVFDPETSDIAGQGDRVKLSPAEGRILHLLFLHEGRVLSAAHIALLTGRIWGDAGASAAGTIDMQIRHMQKKIGSLPGRLHQLRTLPGVGYVINQTDLGGQNLRP